MLVENIAFDDSYYLMLVTVGMAKPPLVLNVRSWLQDTIRAGD